MQWGEMKMIVVLGRPTNFYHLPCSVYAAALGINYTHGTGWWWCCVKKQFAPRDVEHNAHYTKSRSGALLRALSTLLHCKSQRRPSNNLCCSKSSLGDSSRTSSCALGNLHCVLSARCGGVLCATRFSSSLNEMRPTNREIQGCSSFTIKSLVCPSKLSPMLNRMSSR